ncbi:hypothetical protein D3C83_175770 [compost metagenome]
MPAESKSISIGPLMISISGFCSISGSRFSLTRHSAMSIVLGIQTIEHSFGSSRPQVGRILSMHS